MRIPFLKNFRRGFATNSSSSHSFVYMKEAQLGGLGAEGPGGYIGSEFGWEDFRLDTIREKLFYFLVGRIGGSWDRSSDGAEEFRDMGEDFPELTEEDFSDAASGYVDHDSKGLISAEMARDPHLVVFGGNDNGGESQERIAAIRRGEVDWTRTEMDYDLMEHVPYDDEEGQKAIKRFLDENPWAAR